MKNRFTPPARYALLTACLLSGFAHAQSINFTGDTNPTGSLGASHTAPQVIVGDTGTGALSIQNGGQLASQSGSIGEQAGSTGSVLVEGTGSSWSVASTSYTTLTVGQTGAATLQVRNGATVSSTHELDSATLAGTSALVEVDGANSTLKGRNCNFGREGISTHRISNGGLLHCQNDGYLQYGELTLSGAGSKWLSGNDTYIGGFIGPIETVVTVQEGTTIEAGGTIFLAQGNNASTAGPGTINIEGTVNPGVINAAQINLGNYGKGVLNLNHSDASGNYQFTPGILGGGVVNVNGSGTTTLMGSGAYYGWTRVNAGTLRADNETSFSTYSDFVVAAGATLDAATHNQYIHSLDNGGTIILGAGSTSTVLTIEKDYIGNGGVIVMNTELGTDGSPTQRLELHGASSGNTTLNISNLGGTGVATTGNGIMVVQVGGASNGSFSLPAPGYVEAGGYRYTLAKVGNHWFLQSDAHVEASGPEASVVCTPAELSDTANQVATCTVTLTAAPTADLPINLVLPAANPRYTTTCASPLVVPANATQALCTITAMPNTTAGDGDVSLELAIAPPTTADAYTPAGPAAQVLVKDAGDTTQPPVTGTPTPVPTLGSFGLAALAALMGLLGLRRSRNTV
nr:autotransporter outer membrane beta-barrel domain-containing protein [Comamonas koreensis]